jgi:anti-sigma B factor antagonist
VQTQFRVDVSEEGEGTVISLSGELDLASSPALEEALDRVFTSGSGPIVVDLRRLDFMDSTGLSIIVRAHNRAAEAERRLFVARGPAQVQRLLALTGVAERLSLIDVPGDGLSGG